MEVVRKTTQAPGLCLFTADIDGPFLDTGRWIPYSDPYGYVYVPFVEEMGRAVGMIDASAHEAVLSERDTLRVLSETQEMELVELRDQVAAIQTVKELSLSGTSG